MENMSLPELLRSAMHLHSHNESYVIPGTYDIQVVDAVWALSVALVFFTMHTGIAMLEVGVVQEKNRVNVMMKSIVDICAGGMAYWLFGFALMYGRGEYTNPFFAFGDFAVNAKVTDPLMGQIFTFYFFQCSFSTTMVSLISAATAERFRFPPYILFSFTMTFVYAVGAGWVWGAHGWLKNIGVVDFAGTGPIHILAGAGAFVAAWFIGPRKGRYDNGIEPLPLKDAVTLTAGLLTVWWGWIGFNAGSSYALTEGRWELAARAGVGTTLASMSAGMMSMLYSYAKHNGKIDVFEVVAGILSGLVAINCGCYMFSSYTSVIVGALSALLTLMFGPMIDILRVDDAVGAVSVHLVGGVWGQLSAGLFADPPTGPKGLFMGGGWFQLMVQAISAISLTIWAAAATLVILFIINKISPIRVSEKDEEIGCDMTEHQLEVSNNTEIEKSIAILSRVTSTSTPIGMKFAPTCNGLVVDSGKNFRFRRNNYQVNGGFEHEQQI